MLNIDSWTTGFLILGFLLVKDRISKIFIKTVGTQNLENVHAFSTKVSFNTVDKPLRKN